MDPARKAREASKKSAAADATSPKGKSSGRPGGKSMLDRLVSESFFKKPKTIKQVVEHCEHNLAFKYKQTDFSGALGRLTRSGTLSVPTQFRGKLLDAYGRLKRDHAEGRYDAAGLAAGKLCEVVLRFLQQVVTGEFTPFGTRVLNFADECRKLEKTAAASGVESLRIVIPRGLPFLYTMRNKRGIGHVGGDVEANRIDSATVTRLADWVLCELVRIYHGLSLEEAQDLVDSLAQRELPDIWEVAGKKRVLRKNLSASQQALLLLYSDPSSFVLVEDLCSWVDVHLSPLGAREVEDVILAAI